MTLYLLDEADDQLTLLPMAARRALDHAGLRLSLAQWRALPLGTKRELVDLGSAREVSRDRVAGVLRPLDVTPCPERPDPPTDTVPEAITRAFGPERPVAGNVWSALSNLDRYVLSKVAEKARRARLDAAYGEIVGQSQHSSHLGAEGGVRMVSTASKSASHRAASAGSVVRMSLEAYEHLLANNPKGDVLGTARLAGIMGAKRTAELVPLCHPLSLTKVEVRLTPKRAELAVEIVGTVEAFDRTGVEMEALTAVSCAALTVYDMLKAFDRGMTIGPTRLLEKSGGRSGDYRYREGE